jgi:hypothetical protein
MDFEMGTQGVHLTKYPSLVGSLGSLSCLACSSRSGTNMFWSHFFNGFIHIPQQAGQAVLPRHLSLNNFISGWNYLCPKLSMLANIGKASTCHTENNKKTWE